MSGASETHLDATICQMAANQVMTRFNSTRFEFIFTSLASWKWTCSPQKSWSETWIKGGSWRVRTKQWFKHRSVSKWGNSFFNDLLGTRLSERHGCCQPLRSSSLDSDFFLGSAWTHHTEREAAKCCWGETQSEIIYYCAGFDCPGVFFSLFVLLGVLFSKRQRCFGRSSSWSSKLEESMCFTFLYLYHLVPLSGMDPPKSPG